MAGESADPELGGDHEQVPPFLRHGVFTVAVFVVAVSAVLAVSDGDMQGAPLVGFSVGFSVFMAFYFVSMYVAWLFLR
jgi:hypothetical protein